MSKRILLVSPLRNYSMAGSLGNEMYPSGALLLLGTLLRKQGHDARVMHMVADRVSAGGFHKELRDFKPDIVAITVSTYQTKYTKSLSYLTKLYSSAVVVVAGGAHPTALGAKFLDNFPDVDIAVCGEGERTLPFIVRGTTPLNQIPGIHYRTDGTIVSNKLGLQLTVEELDSLPFSDRRLINFKRYAGLFPVGRRPSMFIMSSRGCPYRCTFCSKSIYGNTLRRRSPENILDEVEHLYYNWGVREVHFGDDTFNADLSWAHELLGLIISRGFHKKLIFRVALRVNKKIIDTDLLSHLRAAGVWFVMFGVENGNQAMLDHMKKGITIEEIKRAFRMAHDAGLKTEAFFIVGMPGETHQTVQDSLNLYKEIKPYWGGFSMAMPFPGTGLTEELRKSGNLLCEDYDQFGPECMAVKTDTLSADEIAGYVNRLNAMTRRDKIIHPKQLMYALKSKVFGR